MVKFVMIICDTFNSLTKSMTEKMIAQSKIFTQKEIAR